MTQKVTPAPCTHKELPEEKKTNCKGKNICKKSPTQDSWVKKELWLPGTPLSEERLQVTPSSVPAEQRRACSNSALCTLISETSQGHGMVWVGRDLGGIQFQPSTMGRDIAD